MPVDADVVRNAVLTPPDRYVARVVAASMFPTPQPEHSGGTLSKLDLPSPNGANAGLAILKRATDPPTAASRDDPVSVGCMVTRRILEPGLAMSIV